MTDEAKLQDIVSALVAELNRQRIDAENRGYARGYAAAKLEILALLQGPDATTQRASGVGQVENPLAADDSDSTSSPEQEAVEGAVSERKRAPKGLPAALTERTLTERPQGSTTKDIAAAARDDFERMIKESTIRGELRKGRESGRYEERNGRWYIIGQASLEI